MRTGAPASGWERAFVSGGTRIAAAGSSDLQRPGRAFRATEGSPFAPGSGPAARPAGADPRAGFRRSFRLRAAVLLPLLLLALAAPCRASDLSDEVDAGDLVLRPPRGFWPLEIDVEGSAALAPGGPGVSRVLLALAERRVDGASLVVSQVDAPMPDGPDARDRVARSLVEHFARMGLPLRLGWTTPLPRPQGAVEIVGRLSIGAEERALAVAAGPDGDRHWMVTLSAPPQRLEELLGPFEATVASLRADPFSAREALPADWMILAVFAAAGLVVAAASRILRARR